MDIVNIGNYRGQNMGLRGSVYGWGGVPQHFGQMITKIL